MHSKVAISECSGSFLSPGAVQSVTLTFNALPAELRQMIFQEFIRNTAPWWPLPCFICDKRVRNVDHSVCAIGKVWIHERLHAGLIRSVCQLWHADFQGMLKTLENKAIIQYSATYGRIWTEFQSDMSRAAGHAPMEFQGLQFDVYWGIHLKQPFFWAPFDSQANLRWLALRCKNNQAFQHLVRLYLEAELWSCMAKGSTVTDRQRLLSLSKAYIEDQYTPWRLENLELYYIFAQISYFVKLCPGSKRLEPGTIQDVRDYMKQVEEENTPQ